MSDERKPEFFLLGQKLFRLKPDFSADDRKAHACGAGLDEAAWEFTPRDTLCKEILGDQPPQRVALVCDAGLGKTTNLEWLHAHLAERGSRQLALLLKLNLARDRKLLVDERSQGKPSEALVNRLAKLIEDKAKGDPRVHGKTIQRLQAAGRITLLIDGLDHVTARGRMAGMLQEMLDSDQWRKCPAWISGRPTAFAENWEKLIGESDWQFMRVQELAELEIRFYMTCNAGDDWYNEFPAESRHLLAVPRLLHLICGIIRGALTHAKTNADKATAVRNLQLRTLADVYCRAFLHIGPANNPNDQGLLSQGLRGKARFIGLSENRKPRKGNRKERLQRSAAILGALAYQMLTGIGSDVGGEPNFGSVKLDHFQSHVAKRLKDASQGTLADFERDFELLQDMNIHVLDHLLLREANEFFGFHNPTTQAFFAAYWACRHAKVGRAASELDETRKWVVDALFRKNLDYEEFWQFAAEMPDTGMPKTTDGSADEMRWLKLFTPLYDGTVKDPKSKMPIRSTEFIYRSWPRMEASAAGRKIIKDKYQVKSIPQELLDGFIPLVRNVLPQDDGTSNIPTENQGAIRKRLTLTRFCLHRYCVTNLEYESFDPRHHELRWGNEITEKQVISAIRSVPIVVPLHPRHPPRQPKRRSKRFDDSHPAVEQLHDFTADDHCPVVFVSWFDAWCFAKWINSFEWDGEQYEVALPTDLQWEYACRAGRKRPYGFDDDPEGITCTKQFCNFGQNWDYPEIGTFPVNGKVLEKWLPLKITSIKARNPWGLYQMHGNVWEWCEDLISPKGEQRSRRGGSWTTDGTGCATSNRLCQFPDKRKNDCGFRLAAVPVGDKEDDREEKRKQRSRQ